MATDWRADLSKRRSDALALFNAELNDAQPRLLKWLAPLSKDDKVSLIFERDDRNMIIITFEVNNDERDALIELSLRQCPLSEDAARKSFIDVLKMWDMPFTLDAEGDPLLDMSVIAAV